MRDLLEALADGLGDEPVAVISRAGLKVDAERRSDDLLLYFRDQHSHLAVVERSGETLGVVSLEDVLEELVGEIEDEKDIEASGVRAETAFTDDGYSRSHTAN
jgi:putative hemolysin